MIRSHPLPSEGWQRVRHILLVIANYGSLDSVVGLVRTGIQCEKATSRLFTAVVKLRHGKLGMPVDGDVLLY